MEDLNYASDDNRPPSARTRKGTWNFEEEEKQLNKKRKKRKKKKKLVFKYRSNTSSDEEHDKGANNNAIDLNDTLSTNIHNNQGANNNLHDVNPFGANHNVINHLQHPQNKTNANNNINNNKPKNTRKLWTKQDEQVLVNIINTNKGDPDSKARAFLCAAEIMKRSLKAVQSKFGKSDKKAGILHNAKSHYII